MEIVKKQALKSSTVKAGKRTFFFDVYSAVNGKNYLKITESRVPEKEGEQGKRTSFVLFPEDIEGFKSTVDEMAGYLNQ